MSATIDFRIDINENREIRILQVTDMQPVDCSQQRYDGRLNNFSFNASFTKEYKYHEEFYYLEKSIKDNNPDLILLTGDLVYGEFDDNGSNLKELIEYMDSYKIPWAPVFGNHDNECKLGVKWQCDEFLKAKYCFFKRRELTGNGNYNIGVYKNNKLIRVIYMMDSNGCYNGKSYSYVENYPPYNLDERIEKWCGIYDDQIDFIENTSEEIDKEYNDKIKKTICMHIAPNFVDKQAYNNGYQKDFDVRNSETYSLGKDIVPINGDFGTKGERFSSFDSDRLFKVLKKENFDTIFVGHCHNNNISILCDTIRLTYGVKTSTFDYHTEVGSTLFTLLDNNDYKIEHKFIKKLD